MRHSYPYVSHLICNAGVACFAQIDWLQAIWQLSTDFVTAVTAPRYYIQNTGDVSRDGLGWVWQCNVFGHYVLVRSLDSCVTLKLMFCLSSEPWNLF
jgi:3-keto steroid reductase